MALVPVALAVAGWASNLLDRLGLHFWTPPGSVRGAVDFIEIGNSVFDVADFVITAGTVLLVAVAGHRLARRGLPRPGRDQRERSRHVGVGRVRTARVAASAG
ncbi:hypothetical protein GCM10027445_36110 [Amycolatopsis endophytica]